MNPTQLRDLVARVDDLANSWQDESPATFEAAVAALIEPVLASTGYIFKKAPEDDGFDLYGHHGPGPDRSIGVVLKRTTRPVGVSDVRQLIGTAVLRRTSRCLLVSPSGFTKEAREIAERFDPLSIELLDLERLRNWITSLGHAEGDEARTLYSKIVAEFCAKLAAAVARDPSVLDHIEWRELEKLLDGVLRRLGFDVTLTPSSKDGGKDLVIRCTVKPPERTFYVEVKPWRQGDRPGQNHVRHFVNVVLRDGAERGLLLSSSGFTSTAFEGLSSIEKHRLRTAGGEKVVGLCRHYVRALGGLWSPTAPLEEVLFDETIAPT